MSELTKTALAKRGRFLLFEMAGLFKGFDEGSEGGGFADGEVGENFAIELDIVFLEFRDELAVG